MSGDDEMDRELYAGLQALSAAAFPKRCANCGRTFNSAADYIRETESLARGSGLKASCDDDDRALVELYRNCVCGSTLMDFFADRRDCGEQGQQLRERFGQLLAMLEQRGLARAAARTELLRLMRGEHCEVLESMGLKVGSSLPPATCRQHV